MLGGKLWACAAITSSLALAGFPGGLHAQPPAMPVPRLIPAPPSTGEIAIYPGGAPRLAGAAQAERWNAMGQDVVVRNVVTPTIKAYLPKPGTGTGAAVLVAPGGGFMLLSIKN
ncbi:MAG: alpha/beta hydrolase fold family protein [Alphaproteobacteria bacterium]|nr:alpha/beta hydrolase fold family protein [Alphaproteobacteria bacterium]